VSWVHGGACPFSRTLGVVSKSKKGGNSAKGMQTAGAAALTAGAVQLANGGHVQQAATLLAAGVVMCSVETMTAFVSDRFGRFTASLDAARVEPAAPQVVAYPQAMIEVTRRLLEAPSGNVAEPLGRLVAMYDGKAIDGFFRGTARLLGDVSDEELDELSKLLKACERFDGDDPFFLLAHSVHVRRGALLDVGGSNMPRQGWPNKDLSLRHSRRLGALLRANLLAEDGKGVSISSDRDDDATHHMYTVDTELPRLVAERLYEVVRGEKPKRRKAKPRGKVPIFPRRAP
jgi:hypothetical protein